MFSNHPFLARGFRPFFFFGALYGVFSVFFWLFTYFHQPVDTQTAGLWSDPILWHGHEMVFGFTIAIVSGFLLTAVANWSGGAPARNIHLALLLLLWLAGRIVMNLKAFPEISALVIDAAFIPALALTLAIPLIKPPR